MIRVLTAITTLAVAAIIAACGTGTATNPPATAAPVSAAPVSAAPATAAPATAGPATALPATAAPGTATPAGLTLEVATASVGDHVTGEGGMSLYMFVPDEGNASACNGECADNWPPLVVDDIAEVTSGTGVAGQLGTITREDGTVQVTLGGSPLYYYSGDSAAGETEGQGLNDVWYLAAPDGSGVGAPAA